MMTPTWIVLGAGSGMARPLLRRFAAQGAQLYLLGRRPEALEEIAEDCRLRGARAVTCLAFDARETAPYAALVERLAAEEGELNAISFTGSMPEQAAIDADPDLIAGVIADNFTGPAIFLQRLVPVLEARGRGTVVAISSVAGDRGRLGNYVYGAAKSAFSTWASGLRNRAARKGVHVMTVKPGPVDTPMTYGMKLPFMTSPEAVAQAIETGIARRRNVIYVAPIWRVIMTVIAHIPEAVFKKMSF